MRIFVHNDCPGRRVFAPFKWCPGSVGERGGWFDEIDTCISQLICRQTQIFLTIVFGLNLLFFRYLSKTDAPAHLRLYFKHICAVLLFLDFQENYLCATKENNFGSYPFFIHSLNKANLTYVIKVDKREVLRLYFNHIHVLLLFLVFPGKLPLCSQSESFSVISIIWAPRSSQFEMFSVTYVIKVDKREVLRLSFEYIHVLLLFLVFPGKLP